MKVEHGRISGEEEGDTDNGGIVHSLSVRCCTIWKNGLLKRGLCESFQNSNCVSAVGPVPTKDMQYAKPQVFSIFINLLLVYIVKLLNLFTKFNYQFFFNLKPVRSVRSLKPVRSVVS